MGKGGQDSDEDDLHGAQIECGGQHREDVKGRKPFLHHALEGDDQGDQGQIQTEVPPDPAGPGSREELIQGHQAAAGFPRGLGKHQTERDQIKGLSWTRGPDVPGERGMQHQQAEAGE